MANGDTIDRPVAPTTAGSAPMVLPCEYERAMAAALDPGDSARMLKRAITAALWLWVGWDATAWLAFALGLHGVPTLIPGLLVGAFVWFRPGLPQLGKRTASVPLQADR